MMRIFWCVTSNQFILTVAPEEFLEWSGGRWLCCIRGYWGLVLSFGRYLKGKTLRLVGVYAPNDKVFFDDILAGRFSKWFERRRSFLDNWMYLEYYTKFHILTRNILHEITGYINDLLMENL